MCGGGIFIIIYCPQCVLAQFKYHKQHCYRWRDLPKWWTRLWKVTNKSKYNFWSILQLYFWKFQNILKLGQKNFCMLNGLRFLAQIIIDRYFTNRISDWDILRFCRMHRISFHLFGIVLYTTECLAPLVLHPPNTNSALHSFGQLKSVPTISKTLLVKAVPLPLRPTE